MRHLGLTIIMFKVVRGAIPFSIKLHKVILLQGQNVVRSLAVLRAMLKMTLTVLGHPIEPNNRHY